MRGSFAKNPWGYLNLTCSPDTSIFARQPLKFWLINPQSSILVTSPKILYFPPKQTRNPLFLDILQNKPITSWNESAMFFLVILQKSQLFSYEINQLHISWRAYFKRLSLSYVIPKQIYIPNQIDEGHLCVATPHPVLVNIIVVSYRC